MTTKTLSEEERKAEFFDYLEATKFTSTENLISLTIIATTLFFHVVFTMAFHIVG